MRWTERRGAIPTAPGPLRNATRYGFVAGAGVPLAGGVEAGAGVPLAGAGVCVEVPVPGAEFCAGVALAAAGVAGAALAAAGVVGAGDAGAGDVGAGDVGAADAGAEGWAGAPLADDPAGAGVVGWLDPGVNGCVGGPAFDGPAFGGAVAAGAALAAVLSFRSWTQRHNVSLAAVEPRSDSVHGGSLPDGKLMVIVWPLRNSVSNSRIEAASTVHATSVPWPVVCAVQGWPWSISRLVLIEVPSGMFQLGLAAVSVRSLPPTV